jgi:hypothetical protein
MNELTKAVLAALLLTSSSVMAANDYPASDFQPKVIYSDSGTTASSAPSAKAASRAIEKSEVDPNFPAAHFQPKVVFSDTEYKHTQAAPSTGSSKSAGSVSTQNDELSTLSDQPAASNNNLLGLLALGVVGFLLYNKKSCVKKSASATGNVAYNTADGVTGVEKYLEKQGISKTGVAKYLEKQVANPSTGVAKYMAKQIVKDREAAAAKATGVEKYLRDKA